MEQPPPYRRGDMAILKARREKAERDKKQMEEGRVRWSSEAALNKQLTEWLEQLEEELTEQFPQAMEDGHVCWPIKHMKTALSLQLEEWKEKPSWKKPLVK
jgi:hypothetical protein